MFANYLDSDNADWDGSTPSTTAPPMTPGPWACKPTYGGNHPARIAADPLLHRDGAENRQELRARRVGIETMPTRCFILICNM